MLDTDTTYDCIPSTPCTQSHIDDDDDDDVKWSLTNKKKH